MMGVNILAFYACDFLGDFLAIVRDRHHLHFDLHLAFPSSHAHPCSRLLMSPRSKWAGWNA